MSYLVLARKWRPRQFDDVAGQKPITQTLKNAISSGHIAHAYLFSGPRGVGKTTTARILAKALNCQEGPTPTPCDKCPQCVEINGGNALDVIEIDGASNNSVDDIRELREKVHYVPAKGRYKVYIIDEVHMLSNQAFNALLKTLEEPPSHIIFILATTEAHKIPVTILSRCQRYDFRKISSQEIRSYLDKLLIREGDLKGDREEALLLIARSADGSLRDALSLTDQMISFSDGQINIQDVLDLISLVDRRTIGALIKAVADGDPKEVILCIERVVERGHNIKHFVEQVLQYIRDAIVLKLGEGGETGLDLHPDEEREIREITGDTTQEDLLRYFDILSKSIDRMRQSSQPRLILEMAAVRMAEMPRLEPLQKLIDRLELIESDRSEKGAMTGNVTGDNIAPQNQSRHQPSGDCQQGEEQAAMSPPEKDDRPFASMEAAQAPSMPSPAPACDMTTDTGDAIAPSKGEAASWENGLNWPKVLEQVKGQSMTFGSVLEHIKVTYNEGAAILELALQDHNPFYWRLIEDKKNQALLQGIVTKVSGKNLGVRWSTDSDKRQEKGEAPPKKETEEKGGKSANTTNTKIENSLDLFNREPIIQKAMDIFSAEIVKTHIADANERGVTDVTPQAHENI